MKTPHKQISLASDYKAGWNNGDITVPNRLVNAKDCAANDSRPAIRAYWQGVVDRMEAKPYKPPQGRA